MTRERMIGLSYGAFSALLFSGFTLVSRIGFSTSLRRPDLAALRFGIGGTLLLPVLFRYGVRGIAAWKAVALALSGGLGFALLAYTGFSLAPAAHGAVLLHGTIPLFTFAILNATGERKTRRIAGIALIAAGIALMAYDSVASAQPRQLLGDGFLLLASLSWSIYGVLSRRWGLPPAQGAAVVAVLSMLAFLPVYALLPVKAIFLASGPELLLQAVVQGVLIGAVSVFVYTRAVASLGAADTALFTAAVPCITTLLAVPLLAEIPTRLALAGVCTVTLGMAVAMRRAT